MHNHIFALAWQEARRCTVCCTMLTEAQGSGQSFQGLLHLLTVLNSRGAWIIPILHNNRLVVQPKMWTLLTVHRFWTLILLSSVFRMLSTVWYCVHKWRSPLLRIQSYQSYLWSLPEYSFAYVTHYQGFCLPNLFLLGYLSFIFPHSPPTTCSDVWRTLWIRLTSYFDETFHPDWPLRLTGH